MIQGSQPFIPCCKQAAWAWWLLCLSPPSSYQQSEINLLLLVGLLLLLQLGMLHYCWARQNS